MTFQQMVNIKKKFVLYIKHLKKFSLKLTQDKLKEDLYIISIN